MSNVKRNLLIVVVGGILILGLGAYEWRTHSGASSADHGFASSTLSNATSSVSVANVKVSGSGNFTVSEGAQVPTFDFSKPIVFSSTVTSDVRAALNASLKKVQDALKSNSTDFNAWLQLGNVHQIGGDQQAAEEIWLHAASIFPKSTVPYDNLGNLYLDYLKDYPKAEAMFKKSIALDPHDVSAYRNLVALYTDYGYLPTQAGKADTSAAEDTFKQGIANNPDAYDLSVLLARYYRVHGRSAEAKAAYDVAIATANHIGNTKLAADLKAEKDSF